LPIIRFSAFIKCGELQQRCKGLTLSSFLILPVQRVPRYGLLVKESMKSSTDETAKRLLTNTLELTKTVAVVIDSRIEIEQRRARLVDIQSVLGIELLAPAREFFRDGVLTKICHSGRKGDYLRILFYFII
jgi:FYVE/RhoGEF/PH domain-containing protein 5/6